MTDPDADLRRHPTADELLAYSERQLARPEADRMRQHLVDCESCSRIIVDLAGEGDPADPELHAFWEELRRAHELEARHEAPTAKKIAAPTGPGRLAAALLLLAVFLGGLVAGRFGLAGRQAAGNEVASDRLGPRALASLDLVPDAYLRNGPPSPPLAAPAPDVDFVALRLLTLDLEVGDRVRVEVRPRSGALVVALDDLAVDADGRVELLAPRRRLAAGTYTVEVFGQEVAGAEPVHRYRFTVEPGRRPGG